MHQEAEVGWSGRVDGRGAGLTRVAAAFIAGVVLAVGILAARETTPEAAATGDQSPITAAANATVEPDAMTSPVVVGPAAIVPSAPSCAVGTASTSHRNVDDYGTP